MSPKRAMSALIVLISIAVIGVVAAQRTDPDEVRVAAGDTAATPASKGADGPTRSADLPVLADQAPDIQAQGWLNTDGLDQPDLTDKVVLYEFWTFGCSNCRAVLPYVRSWHERYADDGLVVASIHTPEFDYEADPDAVAAFVEDEGVTYPVALDPDRVTWKAFDNHYWPAMYLHDRDGRRRLVQIGEGSYDETEDAIRSLLGVAPDAPRAAEPT